MTKTKQLCSKCLDNGVKNYETCEHDFNPNEIKQITTQAEARQYAIDWQNWVSEQNQIGKEKTLYQSDMNDWHAVFTELATRFNLTEEFQENGII